MRYLVFHFDYDILVKWFAVQPIEKLLFGGCDEGILDDTEMYNKHLHALENYLI